MRGPTAAVFVLILVTASLLATVWEFQLKEPVLAREPEAVSQKLENVGISAALVAFSLVIPLWLLGGADQDRHELTASLHSAAKVFENASDGVMLADTEGLVVAVNGAFTKFTGYRGQDALGQNVWVLLADESQAEFAKLIWASVRSRGDWRGEVAIHRKDGERITVLYTFSVVRNEAGATAGYVAMLSRPAGEAQAGETAIVHAHEDPVPGPESAAS